MAKPRLIILIRHAQSEGNKNREIHQTTPDHRVKLTPDGWAQAHDAGRRLRKLLRPDDTIQFFTSPYRRTRETTDGILQTLTSDQASEPSPFRRHDIKVYEEPRLREQDFGNFQPCSDEMERMWMERADYGHFFYRIPNGESAADAYDRVSGFNESLWRQFGDDDFASVCVLVTHGLMSRIFLMKWYHFTVEYFEDLRNVDHCEFLIMRKQTNGKYLLENKLRTWSELRRHRVRATKDARGKEEARPERTKTTVVKRRWGGCPNGCNHSNHYKKRNNENSPGARNADREGQSPASEATRKQHQTDGCATEDRQDCRNGHSLSGSHPAAASPSDTNSPSSTSADRDDGARPESPPLHLGRDFGGTYSGHSSSSGSDADAHEPIWRPASSSPGPGDVQDASSLPLPANGSESGRSGLEAVISLQSSLDVDLSLDDLDKAEKEDRSLMGSVY